MQSAPNPIRLGAKAMKKLHLALLVLTVIALPMRAETIHFDDAKPGEVPPGWIASKTGGGNPRWTVVADESAPSKPNVLKQSGEADYAICLKDGSDLRDGFVEVKFKPIAGKEDQGGGIIWRAKDADNYYVCRANALEDNFVLYKTVKGKRTSLDIVGQKGGYGVSTKVAKSAWHTIRVEFAANRFRAIFDGKVTFDVEDNTFADAGKVGVWTKADSVILFDDFSFGPK